MEEKSATHFSELVKLPQTEKTTWTEVFAALDAAQIPHDFLGERDNGLPQVREDIDPETASVEPLSGEEPKTAKVFMSGRSQAVRIPAEFRFKRNEVSIRRDPRTGDLILSEKPSWDEIFAALDAAQFPDDFLTDRNLGIPAKREEL